MIINIAWDPSVTNPGGPPQAFQDDVSAVVSYFEGRFTDDVTFTLHVGFGEVGGTTLNAGNLGQSHFFVNSYSYSSVKTALTNDRITADDFTSVATLPSTDPISGAHDLWLMKPEAVALGLLSTSTAIDEQVGFSSNHTFDYDRSDGITSGQYDFIGTVAHEITEVMGRFLGVGENDIGTATSNPDYFALDLFHYSSSSARSFVRGGFFSIDGTTNLANFNSGSTGDAGDWAASAGNDSFLNASSPGVYNDITDRDFRLMDVLGYDGVRDDYGEDTNFAGNITLGVAKTASIEDRFDADWFRVQLTAGVRYEIKLSGADGGGGTLADPFLSISNSASQQLLQDNDSGPGRDSHLIFTPSATGFYYLAAAAFFASGAGTYTLKITPTARSDLNDDVHSDILWRKDDGTVSAWDSGQIGGAHVLSGPGVVSNSWHIAGRGDFDANGHTDILWQNDNGAVSIWDDGQIGSAHVIANAGVVPNTWHIAGTGDFDNNGHDDILWRNDDGTVSIWDDGQSGSAHWVANPGVVPNSWHIAATGDFDANGHADILWRNDNGAVSIWDDGKIGGAHVIANAGVVANSWHIVATGDFDANGQDDILWQNDNGAVSIWDNGQIGRAHVIANAGVVASTWHIAGTGDYDGNGRDDIVWRNDDGSVSIWNNGAIGGAHVVSGPGVVSNEWHIA